MIALAASSVVSGITASGSGQVEVRFEADAASAQFDAGVQFGPAGEDPSPCPVVRHPQRSGNV